ncbi:hypothetical protein F0344_11110 [Streptomyces finlayi]|uniref:Uncharacterized protein n=1 Tax=Streptomyces finlayi TaxID=67296 RepID=A0A7G7BIB7_9ACTN|nr:hypothetical protein [Streptomyces finlayi]QNE75082.1 hypothetical protein F0344_11110 [Streptomyces finlayi]
MTPPTTHTESLPDRPNLLWGVSLVSLASLSVFLITLALCSVKAYVINDDLPNACYDLRRQSFPPEVACASIDGTMTGTNAGWVVALFFASLVVAVLFASMALAIVMTVRRK